MGECAADSILPLAASSGCKFLLECELETTAQLRGGLAREGHGGHPLKLVVPARDAGCHAAGEFLCFPRSRAGFDDEIDVKLLRDPFARCLIGEGFSLCGSHRLLARYMARCSG